ncbi:MAG: TerC family protein [Phycisphaerae bacterium]|nr:TerC family protein [Phycisphaerae bacterium]
MHELLVLAAADDLKIWAYVGFVALVLCFLALDLGVFHRTAHEVSMKEAAGWSVVWLTCGMAFAVFVYYAYEHHWLGLGLDTPLYNPAVKTDPTAPLIIEGVVGGAEAAKEYITGYFVEKSLAMDNIFVIALLFAFFAIPAKYQHRVLFWGILGALLMRGTMIFAGAALVVRYTWILIVFGLLLLATSLKMAVVKSHSDPTKNPIVRVVKRLYPVSDGFDGQRFFTRIDGRRHITPLFLALVMVEITDLVFAVDSIPAIFAITPDPFIVFTSNVFAILGLRALYFCLAALIARFRYLKPALILILAFVGVKLLLLSVPPYLNDVAGLVGTTVPEAKSVKIDTTVSLVAVLATLALAIVASALRPAPPPEPHA